jgi:hypothetical protein
LALVIKIAGLASAIAASNTSFRRFLLRRPASGSVKLGRRPLPISGRGGRYYPSVARRWQIEIYGFFAARRCKTPQKSESFHRLA